DTSGFIGAMGGATRGLSAFTGAAGLGAAAIGIFAGAAGLGIAISAAREFQTEMIKLNTLVGIQTEQVEEWEGAIKELAGVTGQAPADLARAMFAITSGGARGQQALDLLEQAAKASAIGLGDMTAIGRTATAMLQAFGDEGLTAEKAIDIMTATVRLGNLEASSLSAAFSRVLGPAKVLGSSVEEIGAFMATFTRLGGSTEEAATGLLNVFNLLIKPPKDARDAMVEFGIYIEDIRATLAEDGLPAALAQMKEGFEGNIDAMGRVIPNTRALIGFLNTAGLQAEGFASDLLEIEGALGDTSESFDTWRGSADAAFSVFTAKATAAAITIGDLFLPPLVVLLDLLSKIVDVVQLSADGWSLIAGLVSDFGEDIQDFLEIAAAIPEEMEEGTQSVSDFVAALEGMGEINLDSLQALTAFTIRELDAALNSGKLTAEQTEEAIQKMARAQDQQRAVTAAISAQTTAREKLNEELEAEEEAKRAAPELTDDEIKGIKQLVESLGDELDVLTMTREAIIDKQLVDLRASDTTRTAVAELLEEIRVQNELADAIKETAREKEQAAMAEERRLRTLKRERERKAAAEVRRLERIELARLNAEMQDATRISREFAETVAEAFEDIISQTKSVGEAFGDMVTEILKQLQRIIIQKTIIEPLTNILLSFLGSSATGAATGTATSSSVVPGSGVTVTRASHTPGHFNVSGGGLGGQNVVQQTIIFAPSLIDGRSGARFMEEHAGTMQKLIAEGAQNSQQFANALRGEGG
ncbi:MAG: phage tail tape measure protein, partial [Longimicrobiales bacterium]